MSKRKKILIITPIAILSLSAGLFLFNNNEKETKSSNLVLISDAINDTNFSQVILKGNKDNITKAFTAVATITGSRTLPLDFGIYNNKIKNLSVTNTVKTSNGSPGSFVILETKKADKKEFEEMVQIARNSSVFTLKDYNYNYIVLSNFPLKTKEEISLKINDKWSQNNEYKKDTIIINPKSLFVEMDDKENSEALNKYGEKIKIKNFKKIISEYKEQENREAKIEDTKECKIIDNNEINKDDNNVQIIVNKILTEGFAEENNKEKENDEGEDEGEYQPKITKEEFEKANKELNPEYIKTLTEKNILFAPAMHESIMPIKSEHNYLTTALLRKSGQNSSLDSFIKDGKTPFDKNTPQGVIIDLETYFSYVRKQEKVISPLGAKTLLLFNSKCQANINSVSYEQTPIKPAFDKEKTFDKDKFSNDEKYIKLQKSWEKEYNEKKE